MSTKRLLVIDDAESMREVARVSLELMGGWEVLTAESGLEGLEKATTQHPDAILLDVIMPGMDGPTTFHKLRAHPSTRYIPVILLTGKVQSGDHDPLAHLRVQGAIAKPFDPALLAQQVAMILGWQV